MTPRVDGEVHWFAEQGLFDGLFLMRDEESGTFWDHMTGDAVYGPMVGSSLDVQPLVMTTAEQALKVAPDARVTLSDQAIRRDSDMKVVGLLAGIRGRLNAFFQGTVAEEDDRRPTMDLGLGLWTDENATYYPMDRVREEGRALVDTFNGENVLVFIDPKTFVLSAFIVSGGDPAWDGDVLRLSDASYVENGVLHDPSGNTVEGARPLQVFTRWYGFSLTFPETEVWGER
ncbi:MAG: DUF3179 domain-containing protein [Gemmatimonadetes bacterium]|nr:DUF3179 domain-containing protein [Gemmatimonadota bacterium]NNL31011.1 DUF3179 domain-containing protein [Gemmatimonadota bacterium]